ncbi:hypothetical protein DBV05_g12751, partial [Lasiodiplodia theobromae]
LPPRPPPPSTHTRTRRINTALTTATAHAAHHTALNTAYLSLRALESWALQHCACTPATISSSFSSPSSPSCACSSPSCSSCNPAAAHHNGPDDHHGLIAHAIRRGMSDGAMWDWDEDEDEEDGGAAKKWFRALAVAAARLADGGEEEEELARLVAGARRVVRAVVRAEEGVRRVDQSSSGGSGLSRCEWEALEAMRQGYWRMDGDDDEVVKVRMQAEMMRVPVAYKVAVGGLEGWVKGMEKRYKSLLRQVRGVYAEIGRREGDGHAQSVADALDGPTVLVVGRLMGALGWTQANLDAGASTINSTTTSQGCPGSSWHQLIVTSIPHIGRLLRDVDFAAYKLSRPTNADGSWIDAAPVLAKLRQGLDRYLAWTVANFDRIHVQLCARLAEMQADPIYYNDPLHATVRSAFKTTTGMFVSPRLKQFLPLGVHQAEFASALQKLEPHRATLPARLRGDYNIMWTVHFLYNLGIEAEQKRAQCDKSLALILPDALHLHRESAVRTATARWEKLDAKYAETLDSAVESAEQHDAHSIAARDVLAALRDGESLERAAELATFGNLVGPRGRCVVELLLCAIEWRDKVDAAKAHARQVGRFHALWTSPKRTVQMPFRPH